MNHPNGFAQEIVHPGRQTFIAILFHDVGGHGDDGDVSSAVFLSPDFCRAGVTIHLRHLAIHQHQVIGNPPEGLQRFDAVGHRIGTETHFPEPGAARPFG